MRLLKEKEKKLLQCLLKEAGLKNIDLDGTRVIPLEDGGMGSLYFESVKARETRKMGKCIAEKQFYDDDGIPILVSINVDEQGELFELDIWKTDFSPVIKYPSC